jgi:thioredoxin-related protein
MLTGAKPMTLRIYQLRQVIILTLLCCSPSFVYSGKLTILDDFRQVGRESRQHQIPILVLVSQYHCSYCDRMKEEVLEPLQLNQQYGQRVLIRELSIDPGEMLTTLQGKSLAAADFTARYNVTVTPTLLFLDARGKEAAPRIIGINTVDYLFYYIDDAIDQATTNMRFME